VDPLVEGFGCPQELFLHAPSGIKLNVFLKLFPRYFGDEGGFVGEVPEEPRNAGED